MSDEFSLIDEYFLPLSAGLSADELGIGDDGAVLNVPPNHQLVVVTDTLVSGVHFPEDTSAEAIAWKAVAVNLSDLAAMAAKPAYLSIGLTLPSQEADWLTGFAKGLKAICNRYGVTLIGGDTTKGPLTITVTAHGWIEQGKSLKRSGPQVGDIVAMSGVLGEGGLGLQFALNSFSESEQACFTEQQIHSALLALDKPVPQIQLGRLLKGVATSGIDISDGLTADLQHILEQSNVLQTRSVSASEKPLPNSLGAELYLNQLPLSSGAKTWVAFDGDWSKVLAAGDDYQLCFTLPESNWEALSEAASQQGINVTQVGRIVLGEGVVLKPSAESEEVWLGTSKSGYLHF